MNILPHTPEWYAIRASRVTGSNAGAILGLSPHRRRSDVMRQMVRDYHQLPSEFEGNVATRWGSACESSAILCYQLHTGNKVHPAPFWAYEEWLGATPDGHLDGGGILEVKSPFSRKDKGGFKSLADQPHYWVQMQIEMLCAGARWAHFWQWSPLEEELEHVDRDDTWLNGAIPRLRAFYDEYLVERDVNAHHYQ